MSAHFHHVALVVFLLGRFAFADGSVNCAPDSAATTTTSTPASNVYKAEYAYAYPSGGRLVHMIRCSVTCSPVNFRFVAPDPHDDIYNCYLPTVGACSPTSVVVSGDYVAGTMRCPYQKEEDCRTYAASLCNSSSYNADIPSARSVCANASTPSRASVATYACAPTVTTPPTTTVPAAPVASVAPVASACVRNSCGGNPAKTAKWNRYCYNGELGPKGSLTGTCQAACDSLNALCATPSAPNVVED